MSGVTPVLTGPALVAFRNKRRVDEPNDQYRSPSEHDRDRILYSSAFRRLANVTQVVSAHETQLFHNRLTHSLKVAQIGKRLAQYLLKRTAQPLIEAAGGLDPEVVEAAALAHDLGHPPFGHIAEEELQRLLDPEGIDSFEGNAQSFRIITKLAVRGDESDIPSLNLTRATLRAVLKYPWLKGQPLAPRYKLKWGAYQTEEDHLNFAREGLPELVPSLEARLMDWSDDVAYAVHDVEDFYRAGLIPLDRLARLGTSPESIEASAFLEYCVTRYEERDYDPEKLKTAYDGLRLLFPSQPYLGNREASSVLHSLASYLITRCIGAVRVTSSGGVDIDAVSRHEVAVLEGLTWYYVIDSPSLATLQIGQRRIVERVFIRLRSWMAEADSSASRLPTALSYMLDTISGDPAANKLSAGSPARLRTRALVDYLTSLTEEQVTELDSRLDGRSPQSALDPWLRA